MFKKNSFFVKVFIPVIAVMLLQISIIGIVLNVNGTIEALENAAISTLTKNAETRGSYLEQMMVNYWSNLDRLELSVIEEIGDYLDANGITIEQALGDYNHEIKMLDKMSQPLLDTLRTNASTGVFMLFLDKEGLREERQTRNGLYYRDLDPLSNPADNSDIMFLKGYIDIARRDMIQLDSLWSEQFAFDPENEDLWRGFANPQIAAAQHPGISSANLAYWSAPHLENPQAQLDSNKCITYTRPVFYGGIPVALIGTDVQVTQLEKHFPAGDFESDSHSGYMLIQYDAAQEPSRHRDTQGDPLRCSVLHTTGSYIRRLTSTHKEITLTPTRRDGIYAVSSREIGEGIQAAYYPMRIYNSNTPFSGERWALAAAGTDDVLFSTSRSVSVGILVSFVLTFIVGSILLAFTVRKATDPLISIAEQIESSGREDGDRSDKQVFKAENGTYEINLLCSTLNQMNERRSKAEALVRDERRRYLIALESATDTFLEYDAHRDSFVLYYFTAGSANHLASRVIPQFTRTVWDGRFCHPDDIPSVISFIRAIDTMTVEIRAKASVFSHITGTDPVDGYFWFSIKASNIFDSEGNVAKIIGTAKEITREKLEEFTRSEAARRDSTTGFYNRDFGVQVINESIAAAELKVPFVLCMVHLENFDKLESFYGRVFGAFVLMEFARLVSPVIKKRDVAVRLSNDAFLFYFHKTGGNDGNAKMGMIEDAVGALYAGENTDIRLTANVRILTSPNDIRGDIYMTKPVSIQLGVNKDNIVSAAFDLFERTSDVHSSIKTLLCTLGNMFALGRIAVCLYDAGFGTNRITYQWMADGYSPLGGGIVKISHKDAAAFEQLLDEDGTLLVLGKNAENYSDGVLRLLCADEARGNDSSTFCCVMYENAIHIGRVLFMADDTKKRWTSSERDSLCDIVKIISAHLSIEKSRSASRAKSEFLSRVSHEIRTPMNAIIGMTDIAKSVINDPESLQSSLDQIDFSAKHLLTLINDVLEMSRIESGKMRIENDPFTLDALVSGIETLMRVSIENRGISFKINKDFNQNAVSGDEYRLRQVLVNLLGNASKFTNEGGTITLTVEQLDAAPAALPMYDRDGADFGVYRFSVKDTGIGISPEDQLLVFEAFEQATEISVGQQEGTGLGLAISNNIISAMGGKIELESKLGEGSEFFFTIALELREAGDVSTDDSGKGGAAVDYKDRFKGKRALLVDDVGTNVAVASFTLKETGIDIEVAKNGRQAVDMFTASSVGYYDIIFMDVKMPIMDGFTATRLIRGDAERPDARTIPIVAMTANAYDEDMKKTIESGMNGHVTKPIEREKLFELMERLIGS